MPGIQYHHIGHNPRYGEIALWAMDDRGHVHEDRRLYDAPDASWLDWSHDNTFREIKPVARGRVELGTRSGSIVIADPHLLLDNRRLARILTRLENTYPDVRWYLFSDGLNGAPINTVFADRAASTLGTKPVVVTR